MADPITDAEIAELERLDREATRNWRIRENPQRADQFFVQADRLDPSHPYDIDVLGEDRHEVLYPPAVARVDADLIVALRNALRIRLPRCNRQDNRGDSRRMALWQARDCIALWHHRNDGRTAV